MIRIFRSIGGGQGQTETTEARHLTLPSTGWIWVDVVAETEDVVRDVGLILGVDESALEEAIAPTSLSVFEEHPDHVFVALHGLSSGSGERLTTPETDVFVTQRLLFTSRDGPRDSFDAVWARLDEGLTTTAESPAQLLAQVSLDAGRRYAGLIAELERQTDILEELAIRADPQTGVEVHALRRDVIYLRRSLGPQFDVYEDLSETLHPAVDPGARVAFRRVASHHERALSALESGRAVLGSILETYRGAVADQTNEIMRVLTVFSALLLPLSLIAGIWGMNFAGLPGAGSASGFWVLVGLMAVLAIGLWAYFSKRGFIGAPRVRDIPKAVGLGIYNVGTAPIRAVAGGIKQMGRSDPDQG